MIHSREKATDSTKTKPLFRAAGAFSRLSVFLALLVFVVKAAEQESTPLDYAAISYFTERCARCHGPEGVNYDLKHLAQSPDSKLREIIGTMAENQGQAPLKASEIEVLLAYHRSLMDGRPFLSFNSAKNQNGNLILSGEATPEAKVHISIGEKTYPATIEDQMWQATLPALTDWKEAVIVAVKGSARTELKASEGFSHQEERRAP